MPESLEENIINKILNDSEVIAVVGLSDKKDRPSYSVASYLKKQGYKIIPVDPGISEVLGEKSYPDLESVPHDIDMVDIFRNSDIVPAREAGIDFVMDRCMFKEHTGLGLRGHST